MELKGYEIKFKLYACSEEEAMETEAAIKGFINEHAREGRAVTAKKVTGAINNWRSNSFVRNQIINYFS